jgi:hypothetical protein
MPCVGNVMEEMSCLNMSKFSTVYGIREEKVKFSLFLTN